MSSLDKYRPHNYDFGPPRTSRDSEALEGPTSTSTRNNDDINNLIDYYAGLGMNKGILNDIKLYINF